MENQNIKEYILDLATECILHSENADEVISGDIRLHCLIQAFFCAKKLQEIYFLKYQNQHIQSFYIKFHHFHKNCLLNPVSNKSTQELKKLKEIYSKLKNDLNGK